MTHLTRILIAFLAIIPAAADAGIIISFGPSLTLAAGQEGLLNVDIHSDSMNGDSLAAFIVSFQINAPGLDFFVDGSGNPDELQFGDSSYVFAGNSLAAISPPPRGTVSNSLNTYTESDATIIGGVPISSTDVLLATLHFVAIDAGQYTISVDPVNSAFFFDEQLNPVTVTSPSDGSVTVNGPANNPVPEPMSLILWATGALGLALKRCRRPSALRGC